MSLIGYFSYLNLRAQLTTTRTPVELRHHISLISLVLRALLPNFKGKALETSPSFAWSINIAREERGLVLKLTSIAGYENLREKGCGCSDVIKLGFWL